MADVKIIVEAENDLTVFTVEGELTANEIISYSSEFYDKEPTKLVLWNALKGSFKNISNKDFQRIAKQMKVYTSKRKGGKTAFVGVFDLDYGLRRMYEALAEIEQLPITYRTFRTVEEARQWLFSVE